MVCCPGLQRVLQIKKIRQFTKFMHKSGSWNCPGHRFCFYIRRSSKKVKEEVYDFYFDEYALKDEAE